MRASSDLPTLVGVPVGQVPFGMDELESAIKWDAASYKQKDRLCLTETAKLASGRISDSVTYGDMDTDPVEVPQLLDLPTDGVTAETESVVLKCCIRPKEVVFHLRSCLSCIH
jgi:hypothetical protein